jgi:hypothetical protein
MPCYRYAPAGVLCVAAASHRKSLFQELAPKDLNSLRIPGETCHMLVSALQMRCNSAGAMIFNKSSMLGRTCRWTCEGRSLRSSARPRSLPRIDSEDYSEGVPSCLEILATTPAHAGTPQVGSPLRYVKKFSAKMGNLFPPPKLVPVAV